MSEAHKDTNQANTSPKKKYLSYVISTVLPLFGGGVGAYIGIRISGIIFILVGIMIGIVIGSLIALILIPESQTTDESFSQYLDIKSDDELINYYTKKIQTALILRSHAAERLQTNEFWLQIINIYYSCFTAILAVLSLLKKSDFLDTPSVIFTVTVAILVTYANAQRFGSRATDLKANCSDLENSLFACALFGEKIKNNSTSKITSDNDYEEIKNIIEDFTKKLNDSENHGKIDKLKNEHPILYFLLHTIPLFLLIVVFFAIPILFVIANYKSFCYLLPFLPK